MKHSFETVWSKIKGLAGSPFETKMGRPFTYEIEGSAVLPSRTQYRIGRKDFETAYSRFPLEGPGDISNLVRGSAYVWAILHDRRIARVADE